MVHGWLATRQVVLAYPGWRRFAASRGRGYGARREEASRTKVERAWPACAGPLYGATRSARVEQPSPVVLLPDTTRMLSTSERFFPPTTIDARSGWTWRTMHTVSRGSRAVPYSEERGWRTERHEFKFDLFPAKIKYLEYFKHKLSKKRWILKNQSYWSLHVQKKIYIFNIYFIIIIFAQ